MDKPLLSLTSSSAELPLSAIDNPPTLDYADVFYEQPLTPPVGYSYKIFFLLVRFFNREHKRYIIKA